MLRALSWLRRIITLLSGLLLAVGGVYIVLQSLALLPPILSGIAGAALTFNLGLESVSVRLTWAAVGAACSVIGLLIVAVSAARGVGHSAWVTLEERNHKIEGNSTVRVSRRALRALAAHLVEVLPGVRDSEPVLELTRKGWRVQCNVYVSEAPPLPALLGDVERALRHGLEEQTGHPVVSVDVRAQITPFHPKHRVQ